MSRSFGQAIAIGAVVALSCGVRRAQAVPAFAAQTGQPCAACHVGAFGPELTAFGRMFKIGGYTMDGGTGTLSKIPVSLFLQRSFTNTDKAQASPAVPHYADNANFAMDQISVFLAGRVSTNLGGFVQATFNGVTSGANLDNTDLRARTALRVGGHDAEIGLSLNNGPMVEDPYNTSYAWNYPFYSSQLAPTPAASTILGGPLLGNVIGLTAYAWFDESLYAEAGLYDTMAPGLLQRLGEAYGPGSATGAAPYGRLAYEWNFGNHSAHVGAAIFHGTFNPAVADVSVDGAHGHDTYTDTYVDAGYQYFSRDLRHSFTLNGFVNHEDAELEGSTRLGASTQPGSELNEATLTGTYYLDRSYGATLSWDQLWGSANAARYGSRNGKPDSNAFVVEADWVPFGKENSWLRPLANLKLGAQYTIYTEFDGASRNYDGTGRDASDNNTLFLYSWLVF